MDQYPTAIPVWLSGLLGAWLVLSVLVYVCLVRLVARGSGKVSAQEFGQPDLLLCASLMLWFAMAITAGFGAPDRDVTRKDIIHGAAVFVGIVALIGMYLQYRGINPLRQFGILRRNPLVCFASAVGLVICASPLVMLTGKMTELALNGKGEPQNIVEFFLNASEGPDKGTMYLTMVMGVIIAPVVEETIFRGYIYGVLKRYTGCVPAAAISACLFAAMHLNLSSLPALFVLALCLTLAYEATGTLLVNIFMHALFNFSMFLALLFISRHPASP